MHDSQFFFAANELRAAPAAAYAQRANQTNNFESLIVNCELKSTSHACALCPTANVQ